MGAAGAALAAIIANPLGDVSMPSVSVSAPAPKAKVERVKKTPAPKKVSEPQAPSAMDIAKKERFAAKRAAIEAKQAEQAAAAAARVTVRAQKNVKAAAPDDTYESLFQRAQGAQEKLEADKAALKAVDKKIAKAEKMCEVDAKTAATLEAKLELERMKIADQEKAALKKGDTATVEKLAESPGLL